MPPKEIFVNVTTLLLTYTLSLKKKLDVTHAGIRTVKYQFDETLGCLEAIKKDCHVNAMTETFLESENSSIDTLDAMHSI